MPIFFGNVPNAFTLRMPTAVCKKISSGGMLCSVQCVYTWYAYNFVFSLGRGICSLFLHAAPSKYVYV